MKAVHFLCLLGGWCALWLPLWADDCLPALVYPVDPNLTVELLDVRPWTRNNIPVDAEITYRLHGAEHAKAVVVEYTFGTNDWKSLQVHRGEGLASNHVYTSAASLGDEFFVAHDAILIRAVVLDEARHCHPRTGERPFVLLDIGYDVDLSQSLDLDTVRDWVTLAAARAASNTFPEPLVNTDQISGGTPPGFSVQSVWGDMFHYWPNVLDLTRIGEADPALLDFILDVILALDPGGAALRVALDAELLAGDRVFLARDYIDVLQQGPATHIEVHYALLINLDAETTREIQVHGRADEGVGDVHDPHVDTLQEIFDGVTPVPPGMGEVWQLCLRGNFFEGKYQAIIVDRLADTNEVFYIRRLHFTCRANDFTNPPPFSPPVITNVPPRRPPPPPPFKPPITKVPPPGGDEAHGEPPFRPWPFRDRRDAEELEEEPPREAAGPPRAGWTPQETNKLQQWLQQAQAEHDQGAADNTADLTRFRNQSYEWIDGVRYSNAWLRATYEQASEQVAPIRVCLASNAAAAALVAQEIEALKAGRSLEVFFAEARPTFWCEIFTLGGPWMNVKSKCVNPVITFMAAEIAIVDEKNWTPFEQALRKCLKKDGKWDECAKAALKASLPATGHKYYDDQMWIGYLECLRDIHYPAKLRLWLKHKRYSDAEIERIIPVMIHGKCVLTTAQIAEQEAYQAALAILQDQQGALFTEARQKALDIKQINRDFRNDALANCFPAMKEEALDRANRLSALQDAWAECQSGQPGNLHYLGTIEQYRRAIDQLLAMLQQFRQDARDPNACQGLFEFLTGARAATPIPP